MVNLMRAIILVATTIGAGIFGLPYVFNQAGWAINLFYFLFLGIFIIFIHYFYAQIILKTPNATLLELVKQNLTKNYFKIALISIILGLIFTLLVYLILAGKFIVLIIPNFNFNLAVLLFWTISSISLIFGKFFNRYETIGTIFIIFIILLIFVSSEVGIGLKNIRPVNFKEFFLPFGIILFSLAGWTAVSPMTRYKPAFKINLKPFLFGTILIIFLYWLFVLGIINSAKIITEDSISGLIHFPYFKIYAIALLGLFAIWTSYLPIGLEIKNSLLNFLSKNIAFFIIIFGPIILFSVGFQSFFKVISLAGGLFLTLQYFLILVLIRKLLNLNSFQKFLIKILEAIFVLSALYEIYFSILK